MATFLYIFSDHIWLPLLEFFILVVFFRALFKDIHAKMRSGGTHATVKRGEKSWSILLSFWALSIIVIGIIISSELIPNHKVIIGLLNLGVLVYLNLFNYYFQNKIIGWSTKLRNREG
jgi:ABC-type transport system involved in Fe-S cluster assembly fused permease/ATPase subunit